MIEEMDKSTNADRLILRDRVVDMRRTLKEKHTAYISLKNNQQKVRNLATHKLSQISNAISDSNKHIDATSTALATATQIQSGFHGALVKNKHRVRQQVILPLTGEPDKFYPIILTGIDECKIRFSIATGHSQDDYLIEKISILGSNSGSSICELKEEFLSAKGKRYICLLNTKMWCELNGHPASFSCLHHQGFYLRGGTTYTVCSDHQDILTKLIINFSRPMSDTYTLTNKSDTMIFRSIRDTELIQTLDRM